MGLTMTLSLNHKSADALVIEATTIRSPDEAGDFVRGLNGALATLWPDHFAADAAATEDAPQSAGENGEAAEADAPADAIGRGQADEDEADAAPAAGKRGPITVKRGSAAERVLDCLRAGMADRVEIADRLDMNDLVVARLISQLRKAGHWSDA